jgi:ribosomal protein S18 acetylase RimI-like enzyme
MKIMIVPAMAEDAGTLIEVQNLGFQEDFDRHGECPSYHESPSDMTEMIEHAIVYKILVDEKIVGDVIIRKRDDGSYYLRTIAVLPAYQNLGIGTAAMDFAEKDNPGAAWWSLVTPEGTEKNRHFYEKRGYRRVGEHRRSERLTLVEYRKG